MRPPEMRVPEEVRRPPMSAEEADGPPAQRTFPDVIIKSEGKEKGAATGTAFALDGAGNWMTARHVVNGCDELYLLKNSARLRSNMDISEVVPVKHWDEDKIADIAILSGAGKTQPLPRASADPQEDEVLYHYGFPQSKQGALRSRMIGYAHTRDRNRGDGREPVYVLAEEAAFPASLRKSNGISGGPVLNDKGEVTGVSVAGSRRRGRIYASTLETITRVAEGRHIARAGQKAVSALSAEPAFEKYGQELEKQRRMQLVLCINH